MKMWRIVSLLTLVVALGGALYLVDRNQETRRGAFFASSKLSILSAEQKNIVIGKEWVARVKLTTDKKIDTTQVRLKVSDSSVVEVVEFKANSDLFTTVIQEESTSSEVRLSAMISKGEAELPTGVIELGTIKFRAKGAGKASVLLEVANVTGVTSGSDKAISVTFDETSFEVAGEPEKKMDLVFAPSVGNFKVFEKNKVTVIVKSGAEQIKAARLKLYFDKDKVDVTDLKIESGFNKMDSAILADQGVIDLTLLWMGAVEQAPKGEVALASFNMSGRLSVSTKLRVDPAYDLAGLKLNLGEGSYAFITGDPQPTNTPTVTPKLTATVTPKNTPTVTPKLTATVTPKNTPTSTPIPAGKALLYVNPSSQSFKVGESFKVKIGVDSGGVASASVDAWVKYNKELLELVAVEKAANPPFEFNLGVNRHDDTGKFDVTCASSNLSIYEAMPIKGDLIEVTFKAKSAGEADISFECTNGSTTDTNVFNTDLRPKDIVACASNKSGSVTIRPAVVESGSSVLNYKVAFAKLAPDANCAVGWPLTVTVLGNGRTKTFKNVIPVPEMTAEGKRVYRGSLVLDGFKETENVAVFIKAPKHLQMKYGRDMQDSNYERSGGELVLTANAETSPLYDFTLWPLLPGDVTNSRGGTEPQDGWINGKDFSEVKSMASASNDERIVEQGGFLLEDLDGNCIVNSNDINVLKNSMEEKQEILY